MINDAPSLVDRELEIRNTVTYLESLILPENQIQSLSPLDASYEYVFSLPGSRSLQMDLVLYHQHHPIRTFGLLDSGATGNFINWKYLVKNHLPATRLPHPKIAINVDGTLNKKGLISHEITLPMRYHGHTEWIRFGVTDLGETNLIIGHTWLQHHNPVINWATGTMEMSRCPPECWNTEEIKVYQTYSQKLADQHKPSVTEELPPQYGDYADVFAKETFDELPPRKPWDHAIDVDDQFKPKTSKVYPMAGDEQKEIDAFLEENLRTGRIRPSKSPMASPVFFIKKKGGGLRLCTDYRYLNEHTIKNRYPLPLISELLSKMRGAKIFSKFDVRWGYNNIRIKEGDEWKAAFVTNRGLFEPTVMFFGMCNSPSTFQWMMNDIFRDLILKGKILIYLDDIIIFSKTQEEHQETVREVLQILREQGLSLRLEKSEFERKSIEYLGVIVSEEGIAMDPAKIQGVIEWPSPKKLKELQAFLGFANFYHKFIQGYADIARPLYDLTKKDLIWKWTPEKEEAFQKLKQRVTSAPVLMFPSDNAPYRIETDASLCASGAVLLQKGPDDEWHPLSFISKSFSSAERNYDTRDRELLSIIRALEEWRHFILGNAHKIEIITDHDNLRHFISPQNLNRRQARWKLFLNQFDHVIIFRAGKKNIVADALSRRPDHDTGEEDNQQAVLIDSHRMEEIRPVLIGTESDEWLEEVKNAMSMAEKLSKPRMEIDGLVYVSGKLYIPPAPGLREKIMRRIHESIETGHPGIKETQQQVKRSYWWPKCGEEVETFVKGCDKCNQNKVIRRKPQGMLKPTQIPGNPWEIISVDFIVELPLSQNGHDAILVVVDRFTKMAHFIPCTVKCTSMDLAKLYKQWVWKLHGLPEQVISDRGSTFASHFTQDLSKLLGIKSNLTTAYHPQSDGQTERTNQELETYLRMFISYRQDDWDEWVESAEFAYNNRTSSATGYTPFYLNTGRHPRMSTDLKKDVKTPQAKEFADQMKELHQLAEKALHKAAETMKKYYDKKRDPKTPEFKIGDLVWLDASDLNTTRPAKKLREKRLGPFKVLKKLSSLNYKLQLPPIWTQIHPVFHIEKLFPYQSNNPHTEPPPDLVEGEEQYEVESIVDSRVWRKKLQYRVRWTGYSAEEDTWQYPEDLTNAQLAITNFHKKNPSAPRPIATIREFIRPVFYPYQNLTTELPSHGLFNWENGTYLRKPKGVICQCHKCTGSVETELHSKEDIQTIEPLEFD